MKSLKIILSVFLMALLFVSCEEDESQELNLVESAQVQVAVGSSTFYDLTNVSTTTVDLDINVTGLPVSSVTILKSYNGGVNVVEHATLSTVPASVSIPLIEAIDGLGITADDLNLGDNVTFSFRANLANGTAATSQKIYVANLSCPSNLPEGLWTGVNTDAATFGGSSTNASVMITALGAGAYSVSDVSGAAYFTCCGGGGFVVDQPVTILDVCNTISVTGSAGSQVTIADDLANPGSWDPGSGILTINWCDNSNGFCSTTTFTKN
jgi:hypothetical protein